MSEILSLQSMTVGELEVAGPEVADWSTISSGCNNTNVAV